ncbi:hypothetical protein ABZX65_26500 [Streptomyces sp. NPDC003300]|uniref:hypothetical protein n=1 Tax=unclassified Streptomyces TaxID=2593676 RepID=UPI0033A4D1D5
MEPAPLRPVATGPRAVSATPVTPVRRLPVPPALTGLLPDGLPAGSAIEVADRALLLALAGAAAKIWAAVALPDLGALAAADAGLDISAGLWVDTPGGSWPQVVGLLLDSASVVLIGDVGPVPDQLARRITARARRASSILLSAGPWPTASMRLRVTSTAWDGLGTGHGLLRGRRATVVASGRGVPVPRHAEVWLPDRHGRLAAVGEDETGLTRLSDPAATLAVSHSR